MRRQFLTMASAAAIIAALGADTALADVAVTATVDKDKSVLVDEDIIIRKHVDLVVHQDIDVDRSAESLAVANQRIQGNEAADADVGNTATVEASALLNAGVLQFNNAAGTMNQQGNLLSAALDGGSIGGVGDTTDSFADAQASAGQIVRGNTYGTRWENTADTTDSVNLNVGVVQGNNAAGDMNQQLNSMSLAAAFANEGHDAMALAEADLGQTLRGNNVTNGGGNTATLSNALTTNVGIVSYNQASGALNQQGNQVAISATAPAQAAFQ